MSTVRSVAVSALIVLLLTGWFFVPQYYGIVEDVRQPALEGVDTVHDVSWEQPADHSPNFYTNCSADTFSHALAEEGFTRNPVAKLHSIGDDQIDASWAYRERLGANYQTHVGLNEADDGTEIYVHREYNYIANPVKHFNNKDDIGLTVRGPERFKKLIDDDQDIVWWHVRNGLADDENCTIRPTDAGGT